MKGSLTVVAFFCAGCLMGVANDFQFDLHDLSMYVLYALMFQVGIGIGSNKKLKELVKSLRPKMLLVPMATIVGTLLFSAFASLLLSQWSVFDCMAVGRANTATRTERPCGGVVFSWSAAVRHLHGNRKERQRSDRGAICRRTEKRNSRFQNYRHFQAGERNHRREIRGYMVFAFRQQMERR